jgi:hypothetical protein
MVDKLFKQQFKEIVKRRNEKSQHSHGKIQLIDYIKTTTTKHNIDNITRTRSYAKYYERHKEIGWAFLASMVSRNAGWNMTDLEGEWFPKALDKSYRTILFNTYERANWLIFADAFPQLLIYELSVKLNKPLFYLLKEFSVSVFIEVEWEVFWRCKNLNRLLVAQIINEQNIIQKPVIEQNFYNDKVFSSFLYKIQDWFHFSSVLFPTLSGNLYGFSVHDFQQVNQRIELGKKLAWLLFHNKYYHQFYMFSVKTEHTGSRYDYEQYFLSKTIRDTPFLRTTFPIVKHERAANGDWFYSNRIKQKWYKPAKKQKKYKLTRWYKHKQRQLHLGITIKSMIFKK